MTLLLAGCWDTDEPERMYYIYGLGVDYEDGQYVVTAQIIDFLNVAKSEQPNPSAQQVAVGQAKGDTVYEAFLNLYHSLDMKLFWGHLTYVIFSKDIVEEGRANTVVNALNRYRETRYQIWVYITDEKITDILQVTPVLNKSMTAGKLANPINSFEQESFFNPINFRELIIALNDPSHEVLVPVIRLKKDWETKDDDEEHIEFDGMAVAYRSGLKTILNKEEMVGLRWVNDRTIRSALTFRMDDTEVTVTIHNVSVNVSLIEKGSSPKFKITMKCDAILSDFDKEITRVEVIEAIKKEVENEIRKTYNIGLDIGADLYQFTEIVFRKHNRYYKEIAQDAKIPLNENTIDSVSVEVQRFSAARKEFTETMGRE